MIIKKILKLEEQIVEWFDDIGIKDNSDASAQFMKFAEEAGELFDKRNKIIDTIDAIGDTYITLIGINYLYDGSKHIYKTYKSSESPEFIQDTELSTFIYYIGQLSRAIQKNDDETVSKATSYFIYALEQHAVQEGSILEECIETAFNVINKRAGKMVDGIFVKSEDTQERTIR